MKVKALNDHMNGYGDAPEKKAGTIYDVPEDHAATLIAAGHCEKASEEDITAAAKVANTKTKADGKAG